MTYKGLSIGRRFSNKSRLSEFIRDTESFFFSLLKIVRFPILLFLSFLTPCLSRKLSQNAESISFTFFHILGYLTK